MARRHFHKEYRVKRLTSFSYRLTIQAQASKRRTAKIARATTDAMLYCAREVMMSEQQKLVPRDRQIISITYFEDIFMPRVAQHSSPPRADDARACSLYA